MKNFIFSLLAFACISTSAFAQLKVVAPGDVGIGIDAPAEKLDVDGALKIGNTTNSNDGTIRYTGSDFEGLIDGAWQSLTSGGNGGSGSMWGDNNGEAYFTGGNVGIGLNDPLGTLHIKASSGTTQILGERFDGTNFVNLLSGKLGNAFYYKNDKRFAIVPSSSITNVSPDIDNSLFSYGPNWSEAANAGNLGIGTDAPTAKLDVNGTIKATGTNFPSDSRLKTVNTDKDGYGLGEVMTLKVVNFTYNGKGGTPKGSKHLGLVAQELQKVAPNMVEPYTHVLYEYEVVDGDPIQKKIGEEEYLAIKGSEIPFMLINAIQDQQSIIEEQKSRIFELEKQVSKILKVLSKK